MAVAKNFIEACGGGGVLIGLIISFLVLPLFWRGHSFGQRAMGIIALSTTGEKNDDLNSLAIMIARLTFRTRSVYVKSYSKRPWNMVLLPIIAAIIMHFVVFFPMFKCIKMFDDNQSSNITQEQREVMLDSLMMNTLKRQSQKGNKAATEALQDIKLSKYSNWQRWATISRRRANDDSFKNESTINIQKMDGEWVEISRDNLEELIEEERPEVP